MEQINWAHSKERAETVRQFPNSKYLLQGLHRRNEAPAVVKVYCSSASVFLDTQQLHLTSGPVCLTPAPVSHLKLSVIIKN